VEILCFLDDHSRHAISVTAHQPVTGAVMVEVFPRVIVHYQPPASTMTDNGMVSTTRVSGGRGGRNGFETELRCLGIRQKMALLNITLQIRNNWPWQAGYKLVGPTPWRTTTRDRL
jgi:hypothetical protein